jgi:glucokinase
MEGIMGHRAMRLRFMDMEPDEVFAAAKKGDKRCHPVRRAVAQGAGGGDRDPDPPGGTGRFYFTGAISTALDLSRC